MPKRATAVNPNEKAVTIPGPNLLVTLLLKRLEIIVVPAIIMLMTPAYDMGTPKSPLITGQAAPNKESGRPKPINEI